MKILSKVLRASFALAAVITFAGCEVQNLKGAGIVLKSTIEPSPSPSVSPSPVPSVRPSSSPTATPSASPTVVPSPSPSATPSASPSPSPSPSAAVSMITVFPSANNDTFTNPERGFHNYETVTTSSSTHASNLAAGSSLAIAVVKLDAYINSATLPSSFLTQYTNMFTQARNAGVKMILLHRYHEAHNFTSDPSEAQMLAHIGQLAPILTANADVVFTLHAGFIGAYGEWYYTQHPLSVRRNILNALLNQIPASLTVALRTPGFKIDLFNMTGPNMAGLNATLSKRVGHHNDCFLASSSDEGTDGGYNLNNPADWRDFIGLESKQLSIPVGGESCATSSYSTCANALVQLPRMGFTYLNNDYYPGVITDWKNGGCFDEINRKLGYRFELNRFSIPSSVSKAAAFNVEMTIKNVGYSGMINNRPVKLVLFNSTTSYSVDLGQTPKTWIPGSKVITQSVNLNSTGIPAGTYNVAIWMPDSNAGLQSRAVYSVRFANDGWDSIKGWNIVKNGNSNLSVNVTN